MSTQDHDATAPLDGRIALVTGAGGGIGEATVIALAEAGARVILTGRRMARLEAVAERIGRTAMSMELDVNDSDAVDRLPERLPPEWRDVDILVNNAGHDVGGRERFDEGSAAQWEAILQTNVLGLMRVTRAFIDGMIARDRGHVVNLGSIVGGRPYAGGTAYSASKHAVRGFTESLRMDFTGTGIRVTEIAPGAVITGFGEARWGDPEKARKFYEEIGECLTAEDVARTIVFAVTQPPHVVISQMVIMPASQR